MSRGNTLAIIFVLVALTNHAQTFELTDSNFKMNAVLINRDIHFDIDQSEIRPDAAIMLDSMVMFLKKNPQLDVEVGCYTDERYDSSLSICITCRRANAIRNYIILRGIEPARLTAVGYNDAHPLISNARTEQEHQYNRRTEFKIIAIRSSQTQH